MNGRPLAIVAIAFAVGAVALVVQHRMHEADIRDLRGQVATLSSVGQRHPVMIEVGTPERATHEVSEPSILAAIEPVREAGPGPAPGSVFERAPQIVAAEMRDNLEIAFLDDRPSTNFGGHSRQAADARLKAALPEGSQIRSFDCRESMCRIETSHMDKAHYGDFVKSAFMTPETQLWNSAGTSMILGDNWDESGPVVTVSYIAQPEHRLPSPPQAN